MKNITHIFFDLDNTLWDALNNKKAALKVVHDEFDLDRFIDLENFVKLFTEINRFQRQKVLEGTPNHAQNRFELLLEKFPELRSTNVDQVEKTFNKSMSDQAKLVPHTKNILDYLSTKYTLSLIVNGSKAITEKKLANANLDHYFTSIFSGPDLGYPKPNPELFQKAIKEHNVQPQNALMIGDEYKKDLSGAEKISMNIILLNRWKRYDHCHKIDSLDELRTLL